MKHTLNRRNALTTVAALATMPMFPGLVSAQGYPAKPIRAVIPYAAGGSTDAAVRRITKAMNLGQPFFVENKPGASTLIGTQTVIDAPPDGHTLGFLTAGLTQNQTLMSAWNIEPLRQLTPVSAVIGVPTVLFINPAKHPDVKTLADFVALAKSRPRQLFFASSGGSDMLPFHNFNTLAGTDIEIVNFKGESNVILSMQRGDADLGSSALGSVRQPILNGQLRALAVTSLKRTPMFPDVPTADEAGVKGFEFSSWSGFFVPAGTPRPIVDQLNRAIVGAMKTPEIQKFVTDLGNFVIGNSPEEFSAMIAQEITKWNRVAKAAGIKPA
jgi:tripartite-type tricarboxylate transporter receptor subunit TctC